MTPEEAMQALENLNGDGIKITVERNGEKILDKVDFVKIAPGIGNTYDIVYNTSNIMGGITKDYSIEITKS